MVITRGRSRESCGVNVVSMYNGLRGHAGPQLSAEIDRSDREVAFDYASDVQSDRIAFQASEGLRHEGDAALLVGLLPAMRLGIPMRVSGEVSPLLLDSARRIQPVFRHWDADLTEVSIDAAPRPIEQSRGDRVGAFFSGGVDSFYTALRHRDEITDLIFIKGFDLPLSKPQRLQGQAVKTARVVAAELGMNLIEVKTNVRDFSDQHVGWGMFNGVCLGAIALLFQSRFRAVHLPAGMSLAGLYGEQTPHPLVDPLLGTESTRMVSSGVDTARIDKVIYLANSDLAMSKLRVCWEVPDGAYDCGACRKCLATMISLHVAGALERCGTLPDRLDLAAISRIRIDPGAATVFARENLRALDARGDRRLARALRTALRRGERELRRKDRGLFRAPRR
jgi:hypothetical protein